MRDPYYVAMATTVIVTSLLFFGALWSSRRNARAFDKAEARRADVRASTSASPLR